MPPPPNLDEGVWDRARREFGPTLTSDSRLWIVSALLVVAGGFWGSAHGAAWSAIGSVLGILASIGVVALVSLVAAPIKQRDEAREYARDLQKRHEFGEALQQTRGILEASLAEWVEILSRPGPKATALMAWGAKLQHFGQLTFSAERSQQLHGLLNGLVKCSEGGQGLNAQGPAIISLRVFIHTLSSKDITLDHIAPGQTWETWVPFTKPPRMA